MMLFKSTCDGRIVGGNNFIMSFAPWRLTFATGINITFIIECTNI